MSCGCGVGHVCRTWGSGIVSSAADVLWMNVVRGMQGVVQCVRCVCVWLGAAWGSEWMRGLGLSFTNPVRTVFGLR